jgi:hypothetical protein
VAELSLLTQFRGHPRLIYHRRRTSRFRTDRSASAEVDDNRRSPVVQMPARLIPSYAPAWTYFLDAILHMTLDRQVEFFLERVWSNT